MFDQATKKVCQIVPFYFLLYYWLISLRFTLKQLDLEKFPVYNTKIQWHCTIYMGNI